MEIVIISSLSVLCLVLFALLLGQRRGKLADPAAAANACVRDQQQEEQSANLKLALEAGQVNVWRYDVSRSAFFSVYGTMQSFQGSTVQDVVSIIHPDYRDKFTTSIEDLLSDKVREVSFVNKILNKEGQYLYCNTHIRAVYSTSNSLESLLGSQKDITDEYHRRQKLEESILQTSLAIKTSDLVLWNYDCQSGTFYTLNDPIGDSNGFITPDGYLSLMHPENYAAIERVLQLMSESCDFEFGDEVRMKLPGFDTWQYVSIDGTAVKDETGKVVGYTGFRKNNTKFVELNKQLAERNIHLNMIFRAGYIIPSIYDPSSGIISLASDADMYGADHIAIGPDGVLLSDLFPNIHPQDRELLEKQIDKIKTNELSSIQQEIRYLNTETSEKTYEINFTSIDFDLSGKPSKIVGYIQNITERKEIETKLSKQRLFMNTIFDQIPVPLHIKDMDNGGKYVFWNQASGAMFGDALGKSVESFMSKENVAQIEAVDRQVYQTEIPYVGQETIRCLNGAQYETMVHKSVIYDDGHKLLLAVRWDVSSQSELQRKHKILSISMSGMQAFTWQCDMRDEIIFYGSEIDDVSRGMKELNTISLVSTRIHPDHSADYISVMNALGRQSTSEDLSFVCLIDMNGDGIYEWWELRGTSDDMIQAGEPYKFIYGIAINIDKHKQNELAILKNKIELDALNEQNELIMNNANLGLVFVDNDYRVQWENLTTFMPHYAQSKNYKKGEFCHREINGLSEPCPECIIRRSYASNDIESNQIVFGTQDIELTAVPVLDAAQNRLGTVLKIVDITEQLAAQLKLKTANDLMRKIIDCLPCMLFIKDADDDFRHVMVNHYFCDVLGLSQEEIIGKSDYQIMPTVHEAERCRRDDIMTVESDGFQVFEEETNFQDRHIIWKTTKTSVLTAEGHRLVIALALDITDKIEAYKELEHAKERADQSNKLKSAFLANMSHEIRTPLNAIVGFSELMIETNDQHEKQDYFNIISSNNELLLRLVNDILDLSKIEAGMIELKPFQFDLSEFLVELSTVFEKRMAEKNLKMICETPDHTCMVRLDKNRITQVMSNFITNALKFTPRGYIKIGCRYEDNGVRMYVSDSGIGISEDKIDKVFDRFEKLNDFAQGTGLGMAISKAIVDGHNGKIGVESTLGQGSMFWAWLPVDPLIVEMNASH